MCHEYMTTNETGVKKKRTSQFGYEYATTKKVEQCDRLATLIICRNFRVKSSLWSRVHLERRASQGERRRQNRDEELPSKKETGGVLKMVPSDITVYKH